MIKPCPICKTKIKDMDFTPFCSKRCADIDLGRWLKGSYAIAASSAPDFTDIQSPEDQSSYETPDKLK